MKRSFAVLLTISAIIMSACGPSGFPAPAADQVAPAPLINQQVQASTEQPWIIDPLATQNETPGNINVPMPSPPTEQALATQSPGAEVYPNTTPTNSEGSVTPQDFGLTPYISGGSDGDDTGQVLDPRVVEIAGKLQAEGLPVTIISYMDKFGTLQPVVLEIAPGISAADKSILIGRIASEAKNQGMCTTLEIGPGEYPNGEEGCVTFAVEQKSFTDIKSFPDGNIVLVYHTKVLDLQSELICVDRCLEIAYYPTAAETGSNQDAILHFLWTRKTSDVSVFVGRSTSGFLESMKTMISLVHNTDGSALDEIVAGPVKHYSDSGGKVICTIGLLQDVSAIYPNLSGLRHIQSGFFSATNESNPLTLVCQNN